MSGGLRSLFTDRFFRDRRIIMWRLRLSAIRSRAGFAAAWSIAVPIPRCCATKRPMRTVWRFAGYGSRSMNKGSGRWTSWKRSTDRRGE
ncbi:hypothetical protein JOC55_003756 [Paenibacillus sacheonensis]|nr:hypothetical protein [Paenibacillus sacheonensis]